MSRRIEENVNREACAIPVAAALHWHLTCNHYPPVSPAFIPVALQAIEFGNAGLWETDINMPNGITLPVREIVDQLHLDGFLEGGE